MAGSSAGRLNLRIATPLQVIEEVTGVENVYIPTRSGQIGVLPEHSGLISEVGTGVLFFEKEGSQRYFVVSGGVLEVQNDTVQVLADVGEAGSSIDLKRAKESLERARRRLSAMGQAAEHESTDVDRALIAEKRAMARILAAERSSGRR